ncbi:caspase family protein [Dactylosporangium roseum]|uniref:Caspase family protein n=1 Tax=Dactylosporangium roseum TaxID=47989 RepID=A0ABY5ZCQ3_9ACTN|nr:caspase family protein [Dactylosporangium roseum]UWZ38478.1 caspase family protein [Dactylosporangium roseum]
MKFALCIGINDYPGVDNDLTGCRNDADDWATALGARGFEIRELVDSAASGAAIRTGIRDLLGRASSGDSVVITYSGHGTWVPDRDGDESDHRDEALCPHDIAANGPLVDDELFTLFERAAPGVRTVLISDSCHSGTLTRLNRPIGDHRCPSRFLPPSTFLPTAEATRAGARPPLRAKPRSAALLLAGCKDSEYSYDATFNGRPNGAFTYVALTTLAELPEPATYRDWLRAIRAQLPSQNYPQTPALQATAAQLAWPLLS